MRLRRSWLPGLVGISILLISYGLILAYNVEFPQSGNGRTLLLSLCAVAALILAGAAGSFLALKMRLQRGERLLAGLSALMVVILVAGYVTLRPSTGIPTYKLIWGLVSAIWQSVLYLLIGIAPFLLPGGQPKRQSRSV
jgi:hypothetical protein